MRMDDNADDLEITGPGFLPRRRERKTLERLRQRRESLAASFGQAEAPPEVGPSPEEVSTAELSRTVRLAVDLTQERVRHQIDVTKDERGLRRLGLIQTAVRALAATLIAASMKGSDPITLTLVSREIEEINSELSEVPAEGEANGDRQIE